MYPVHLLINGCPPVYTPFLEANLNHPQHAGSAEETGAQENEANQPPHDWDSEGEEEINKEELDILYEATNLAMEENSDSNVESDEESEVDTEEDSDYNGKDEDYNPRKIQWSYRCAQMSKPSKKANVKTTPKQPAGDKSMQKSMEKTSYVFCPPAHRLPIIRLLSKHFCLHPLLPERHGKPHSSMEIYHNSVHEMYIHCSRNNLFEVWAYMWVNWYTPEKWQLWAHSSYDKAISCRQTTMVVEAM